MPPRDQVALADRHIENVSARGHNNALDAHRRAGLYARSASLDGHRAVVVSTVGRPTPTAPGSGRSAPGSRSSGALYGFIIKTGQLSKVITADSEDANDKAMLDLVSVGFDLIPMPGKGVLKDLAGKTYAEMRKAVVDALKTSRGETSRAGANDADEIAKNLLTDQGVAAMTRNGLFGSAGPPPAPTHPAHFVARGAAGYFLDSSGQLLSLEQIHRHPEMTDKYRMWRSTLSSGYGWVESAIRNSCNDKSKEYRP